jgi:acyl-CoA synthetase (NDP forming)
VAVIGASERTDSMGAWALTNLARGGYKGDLYAVNPAYEELHGLRCYPSLSSLPSVPELLIFAVADHRIEAALDEAIALGIPAAVLMSSLHLDEDTQPALKARVQKKCAAAGMLVCGANGMGFYNVIARIFMMMTAPCSSTRGHSRAAARQRTAQPCLKVRR